jgi:serine/threonine-protein kinase
MPQHSSAARDLLFGLLALQNGLISRDQLVAAFAVWTASSDRPMADILESQEALVSPHRALVEALVEAHLKLHGGEPEKSLAALDLTLNRSTRQHLVTVGGPEIEETLAHVGIGSADTEPDLERTAGFAQGDSPFNGQRFRVLRPHAQGGLGAVFVALDSELNREVALKQILERHADDPSSRQRFLIEAEITGGLEHPGIVPVYGLGTYQDGRPYYAMRFVRGDSLKEAIARFHARTPRLERPPGAGSSKHQPGPTHPIQGPDDSDPTDRTKELELRRLLRRFLDVCNAIEYAHSRGVLHRDIKPGNVIVGRHGETLVVDWGLAKPLGKIEEEHDSDERPLLPSSASGSVETLPGSALGTPAYMSPEQAAGDLNRLGPRSDVYALGATLYYLLTGQAPFEGDVVSILRKVQKGEFVPPRQLDPSIDGALEAICLKAMANRPEDRYPTCRALANDIEHWTADEPVSAWREPWARRLGRWARKHRPLVAAAAALLATATITLGLSTWWISQERDRTEQARLRAEGDFAIARQTVDQFLGNLMDVQIINSPRMETLRRQFARAAVECYTHFVETHPDDDLLRRDAARAYRLAAHIERLTGHFDNALYDFGQARRHLDAFLARRPDDLVGARDRALESIDEADLLRLVGKLREADPVLREALKWASTADSMAVEGPERGRLTGFARLRLGYLEHSRGRHTEAVGEFTQAAERLQPLADALRASATDETLLLMALRGIAWQHRLTGERDRSGAAGEVALRRARDAVAKLPDNADVRNQLALTLAERGRWLMGDPARTNDAGQLLDDAVKRLEALQADHPDAPHYRDSLGEVLTWRGELRGESGRNDLLRALDLMQALAKESPQLPRYRRQAGEIQVCLGRAARLAHNDREAADWFAKGEENLRAVLKITPDDAQARDELEALTKETSATRPERRP